MGAPEWAAERAVTAQEAAALVAAQFPQLAGAPVEPFASGWDNTVHLVDHRWLFRFPRRAVALPGAERERALLPLLAPSLPVAVPVPELVGAPTARYPWPFWGARMLPGRELADATVGGAARVALAARVGGFLRALHSPQLAATVGAALPVDPMRRAEPATRAERIRSDLAALAAAHEVPGRAAVDRLLSRAERLGPPRGEPVLVHGDLHLRHVLVDDAGSITGVIDWGDVCRADAAVDLSLAYAGFDGAARASLLAAYGPVDPERELRARVLAVFLCAVLARYALDERRNTLRDRALAGIGRAADG